MTAAAKLNSSKHHYLTSMLHREALPYEVINDADAYYVIFISLPKNPTQISCRMTEAKNEVEVFLKGGISSSVQPTIIHFPQDANLREMKIESTGGVHLISIPKISKPGPRNLVKSRSRSKRIDPAFAAEHGIYG